MHPRDFQTLCELACAAVESPPGWRLTVREILSSSRRGPALRARTLVVGVCRDGLNMKLSVIASLFGRRGLSGIRRLHQLWLADLPAEVRERYITDLVARFHTRHATNQLAA